MKKFILMMVLVAVCLPVAAHDHWDSGFSVGAEFNYAQGSGDNNSDFSKFRGATVVGEYKFFLIKGLFIKPGLTVYYEEHDYNDAIECGLSLGRTGSCGGDPDKSYSTEIGMGVSAIAGYCIPVCRLVSLDLMTGPYYSFGISQRLNIQGIFDEKGEFNRSSFRWRFGLGVNVWKVKVGLSYDVSALKVEDDLKNKIREKNVLSVGIGYNF